MKRVNFAVVIVWMALFMLSIRPSSGEFNVLDRAVYHFNSSVWSICYSCTTPPRVLYSGNATMEQFNSLEDPGMTHAILINSFWWVVFFMAAVNIAFYSGKNRYDGCLNIPLPQFLRDWREKRKHDTLQKSVVQT